MYIKLYKNNPTSNGVRHQLNIKKNLLSKTNRLFKKSLNGIKNQSGRGKILGQITVRHKGNGVKKLFRTINFLNNETRSLIITTMYDPFRSSFIFLTYNFFTGSFFTTLATASVPSGALVYCSSKKKELRLGSRLQLQNIPAGSIIHSISKFQSFSKCIRSAGTFGQLIQKDRFFGKIKLPSSIIVEFPINSYATLGVVSNKQHSFVVLGKAGRNRLMGKRPCVRGIAMNPVDHPHGGRTNGGMPSVTPWGIPTKGKPTVKKIKNL